jgi:4-hydroxybenzoate polyprenyltransferase/phosphoserine phosphatase
MRTVLETEISASAPDRPLVVDLDGTLITSDLLVESLLAYIARNPLGLFQVIGWMLKGKATLKARLAEAVDLDVATLPYNSVVVDYMTAARDQGRITFLASAANERYVQQVSEHLGVFDGWTGSGETVNLAGRAKADHLVERFGHGAFDYIGDSSADLKVWTRSGRAVTSGAPKSIVRRLRRLDVEVEVLAAPPRPRSRIKAWLKLIRPHQWAKNTLVFVPMAAAHLFTLTAFTHAILAFASFSLCASSVYLVNDLLDIQADRGHPRKRLRAIASGEIPVAHALAAAVVLLAASVGLALVVGLPFVGALACYYVLTNAYSFYLKRKMIIDAITLALLYTTRVLAGAAAVGVGVSQWLLGFCMFIFLCLALVKRHSELALRLDQGLPDPTNRNYRGTDLTALMALAAASGFSAVIIFSMYIDSATVNALYVHKRLLWLTFPPLLYWICRVLMMTHRRDMHDDPVVFALKDRNSLISAGLVGLVMVVATL